MKTKISPKELKLRLPVVGEAFSFIDNEVMIRISERALDLTTPSADMEFNFPAVSLVSGEIGFWGRDVMKNPRFTLLAPKNGALEFVPVSNP